MRALVALLLAATLVGCGGDISRIRALEKKGKVYEAWLKYQSFAAKNPDSAFAPEALFRAGLIAQRHRKDCFMANTFYSQVVERYPQSTPWARAAAQARNNCPDFFPLIAGNSWVEGDSETHGRNARIEIECREANEPGAPSERGILARTYMAGETKFKTTEFAYRKTEEGLVESPADSDVTAKLILAWPVQAGARWTTKAGGRLFRYEITKTGLHIDTAAGAFENCIRVQSTIDGAQGAKNDYYAPDVGHILTTVSAGDGEKRNTELLSYKMADWPDFSEGEKKK